MTAEERLGWRILYRQKEGVEADIDEIIQRSIAIEASTKWRASSQHRFTSSDERGRR